MPNRDCPHPTGRRVDPADARAVTPRTSPDSALRMLQTSALLAAIDQAIVTLDRAGRIIDWNPSAEALHGLNADQALGRDYRELIPPALQGEFATALGKLEQGRRVRGRRSRRLHADGTELPVNFSIFGLHGENGELAGFLTISRDVSARLAMEQDLRRQTTHTQAIVQTVVDGIISIDAQGIITAVNPSTERLFGYPGHEMIGRNVSMLMPEPYRGEHDRYLERYLETGEPRIIGIGREVQARRRDGSVFPIDLAVSQLGEDPEAGFVGVIKDISERKAAEQALQDLNARLETKVDELARALEHLRQTQAQLVEAEKLASLGELVAGVAHEINTPIGICVTAASHLRELTEQVREQYSGGELSASGFENFMANAGEAGDILQRNLGRAAELIQSFKQVAVDRSSNSLRHFVLKDFIDELLASLRPQLRRHRHAIRVDCDPELAMESLPGALSQVLANLVQNAVIHAFPEGRPGHIEIQIQEHGEQIRILFRDDGCGMREEHRRRIFEPFFTTRRGQGGTGLGLSVSYNLVRHVLEGEIEVRSAPGRGTEFELTLPRRLADGGDVSPP